MSCISGKVRGWLIFVGVAVLIFGFAVTGFWKTYYDKIIFSKLSLSNDSEAFKTWKETAVPLFIKFYLFNWTNPQESLNKRERPKFVQIGPYVFREHHSKRNVSWHSNDTMTYSDVHSWYFMSNMSIGPLTDTVTTINMVPVTVLTMLKDINKLEKAAVDAFVEFNEKNLFITKTVGELLFDGYDDKIIDILEKLKKIVKKIHLRFDRFGWWYGKNMTSTGVFNMFSGIHNINLLGELNTWNNHKYCGKFKADCDVVHGSLGEVWPLNMPLRTKATIFIPDLCSTFALTNNGTKKTYSLEGISFVGTADIFDNGTKVNDTRCYCPDYSCNFASGVRNVSSCLDGAPAFISYPHFYLADDSYTRNIDGMEPNSEKHTFHVTMEKHTGILIEAFARLQINVFLQPIKGFRMTKNVPEIFVPVVWFEQYITMPNHFIRRIDVLAVIVPNLLTFIGFFAVCSAAIFLLLCLSA